MRRCLCLLHAVAKRSFHGCQPLDSAGQSMERVVNSQGKISLSNPVARQRQRALLEAEGIEFDPQERINLARFGWDGLPGKD